MVVQYKQITFQDVLDTKLDYDKTNIGSDNPNNWMWAVIDYNKPPIFHPIKKIEE
jgi:hypothetical protein